MYTSAQVLILYGVIDLKFSDFLEHIRFPEKTDKKISGSGYSTNIRTKTDIVSKPDIVPAIKGQKTDKKTSGRGYYDYPDLLGS